MKQQSKYDIVSDKENLNKILINRKVTFTLVQGDILKSSASFLVNICNMNQNDSEVFEKGGQYIQYQYYEWINTFGADLYHGQLPVNGCSVTTGGG